MDYRLVGAFVLCLLCITPVYALTIIDVSEVSTTVLLQQISDCEWLESIETRTTTTYRESYYRDPDPVQGADSSNPAFAMYGDFAEPEIVNYLWVPNPCFPDPEDTAAIVPDYCTANSQEPALGGGIFLGGEGSLPLLLFREWSEVSISSNLVHRNECHACPPDPTFDPDTTTPTPEPGSWILGVTGLVGLLLLRRRSCDKRE